MFLQQGRVTARSSGSSPWVAGGPGRGELFGQGGRLVRSRTVPQLPLPWLKWGLCAKEQVGLPHVPGPISSFIFTSICFDSTVDCREPHRQNQNRSPTSAAQRASPSSASDRVGRLVCHSVSGGPVTVTRGILPFRKHAMNAMCPHFGVLFVGILTSGVRPQRVLWWDSGRISDQRLRPQTTDLRGQERVAPSSLALLSSVVRTALSRPLSQRLSPPQVLPKPKDSARSGSRNMAAQTTSMWSLQ